MLKNNISEFLKGVISIGVSQILIKVFGLIYTLYLTNKNGFGDKGNAIYMSGYQIYALLLTLSSIGVPNAISKIISEKNSIKDYKNSQRIFFMSILLFATIGFIGSVGLFFSAKVISKNLLKIPESTLGIKVLSPAIFFVSISSVIRGFCNGESKISITAKSQFLEQFFKFILTILLVEIFSKLSDNNVVIMAASANFATTLATLLSLIFLVIKYLKIKKEIDIRYINGKKFNIEKNIVIIKNILTISMPITMSAILSAIGKNIDSVTIVRILKNIIGEENAIKKYGIITSKVDVMISFLLSLNIAISTSLIPEISKRKTLGDIEGIEKRAEFSIFLTCLVAIPCSIGMFFYSEQIFKLLFPNALEGTELLKLATVEIIFSLLTQTINGIFIGIGKNNIPVYASLIGIFVKFLSNIILIHIENIYEKGAIIGNVLSSIVSFIIVYIILRKNIKIRINIKENFIKPFLISMIMIYISYKFYFFMFIKNINYFANVLISIIIAIIIYIIFTFFRDFKKNLRKISNL